MYSLTTIQIKEAHTTTRTDHLEKIMTTIIMDIATALKIAAEAAAYPRCFNNWPLNEAELGAEKVLRLGGQWEVLPDFRLLPEEKAALAAEMREFGEQTARQMAVQAEKDAAKHAARRAADEAAFKSRLAAEAKREKAKERTHTVTAKVAYLGGGFYGIRVDRSVRSSKEVPLAGLTSADKGREVTVEVGPFDAKVL